MKLTINSTFDYATIASSKAAQELKPFIDHYNQSLEQIVRAFKNRLTFEDQFLGQQTVVEMQHNVETKVALNRMQVLGVIPLGVSSTTDALTNMVTGVNQQGQLVVTPQFKLASATKINVTLFILFPNEA